MIDLIIKGQNGVWHRMDIGEAELNIVWSIIDIKNGAGSKEADFVIPFTIPGTKNNNKVFDFIFEEGYSVTSFNPNKKLEATLTLRGNEIYRGFIGVNSVTELDKVIGYEITMYSSITTFLDELSKWELNELIDLSEFDHIYNNSNIIGSWDNFIKINGVNSGFQLGRGYVYPKEWRGQINTYDWKVEDFLPAPYVKTIWDKVFSKLGWTYKSKFLNSEKFRRLILPATKPNIELSEEEINKLTTWVKYGPLPGRPVLQVTGSRTNTQYSTRVKFNDKTELPAKDIGNHWDDNSFTLTIPKNGKWRIESTVQTIHEFTAQFYPLGTGLSPGSKIKLYGGSIEGKLELMWFNSPTGNRIIGSTPFTYNCPEVDNNPLGGHTAPVFSLPQEPNVFFDGYLPAGAKIIVLINWRTTGSNYTYKTKALDESLIFYYQKNMMMRVMINTWDGNGNVLDSYDPFEASRLIMTPLDKTLAEGDLLKMNWFIPDMKADVFINEITRLFNLYWKKVGPKEFIIEPRDDFYTGSILDWTDKVDNDFELTKQPLFELVNDEWIFTLTEDSDFYNKDYSDKFGEVYGRREKLIDNDFIQSSSEVVSQFAASPLVDFLNTGRILPAYVSSDGNSFKPVGIKQRIHFYGGLLPTTPWRFKSLYTELVSSDINVYPYAGHFDNPINTNWDLNFGISKQYYFKPTSISNGNLYNIYWRNHIEEISDKNSYLLTGRCFLNDIDIINFDIRNLIQINNVYYRVNQLTIDPINGIAEFELFRAKNWTNFIPKKLPNSSINAIEFQSGSKIDSRGNSYVSGSGVIVNGEKNYIDGSVKSAFVNGSGNSIMSGSSNISINGSNNFINSGVSNVTIIGDGANVNESNVMVIWGSISPTTTTNINPDIYRGGINTIGTGEVIVNKNGLGGKVIKG